MDDSPARVLLTYNHNPRNPLLRAGLDAVFDVDLVRG
jgi:hypothetical protein